MKRVKSTANTPLAGMQILSIKESEVGGYKKCEIKQPSGKTTVRDIPDRWIEEVAA